MPEGNLNRDVTKKECSWLSDDLKNGKVVYRFYGTTYGCIGPNGVAVSDKNGEGPFYEVPSDSVTWNTSDSSTQN